MPFDPNFMGPRSAFTWPGPLDSNAPTSHMMPHELAMAPNTDPSLTPPSSTRSLTGSPPRVGGLTPHQRELKKHQDRVRRDSRLTSRIRRTSSNHSFMDSPPPPMTISDVTSAGSIPAYTTAPTPISLLAEPVTSMPTPPYMPSYSPPIMDQSHGPQVYSAPYQQPMQHGYTMSMDYPTVYSSPNDYRPLASARPSPLPVPQDGLMYSVPPVMPHGGPNAQEGGHVRVVQSRPKPRCWEHGCNGRQFSTFSNLLRHQREKSGQAAKASCPNCGAEFTRTTARNGHLLHDKCKQRRNV
ncbi:hypothetical protein S7711_00931 [Stachybotrys chartarum IBT 7711]|uniref:C2H2-type domain-containing protein n=1 Tax=Stachybotrys chartarum (strain CBS 109288 / IBT 7711) TaxID=1280523 RepID=A0A084B0N0_STACB|nr:hypothetical protein S7711_00931 [Stachybotrys chartarum IBT 7711]KFA50215.1 hypothetical protein S40293_03731 [Stachybotrys chartarum IBT 40293]